VNSEERDMLRESLGRLLAETDGPKIPAPLAEFGWFDLLAGEPGEAVAALFEAQGERLVASPMLGLVMAQPLECDTVVVPAPGAVAQPASVAEPGAVHVRGYAMAGVEEAGCLAVPCHRDGELVIVSLDAAALSPEPVGGIDPDFGLIRIDQRVEPGTVTLAGADAERGWGTAVAAGRRALTHELLGASRRMLALAIDHAGQRHQFGRPIGSFQAIKHRLADAYVALTAAEAAATEAWADDDPMVAALAKLWAGRAARIVAKQAQQTLGGMGFTWEHPFHRYARRTILLDSLLGSAPQLAAGIGRDLVTTGRLPQLAAL
jgi:hypothetical protein